MQDSPVQHILRSRDLVAMPPAASVAEACATMRDRRVGAVVVLEEDGRLAGIFTGRDAVCRILAARREPASLTMAEVMTPSPATLHPEASALDALRIMQDGGFRHLPIVGKDGRVIGIVSRGDFRAHQHARLDAETGFFECLR